MEQSINPHAYCRLRFDEAAEEAIENLANVLQWHRNSPFEGLFVAQKDARAGMNAAPPHLILLSGLSKCNQSANSISSQVRHASTQFPQVTGRFSLRKVTAGACWSRIKSGATRLTLGGRAGGREGLQDEARSSLRVRWDLLPRFRGTCIQSSDEARPFPNPRMPLMGSLASASRLVGETTTVAAVGGLGDGFGGFGSGGLGGLHGDAMPQRNTNFATDYDAASSILASVGSGGAGGLGLGFGGSAWGAGGGAFGGSVFSTSPVGGGSGGGQQQQTGGAPGSYSAGGALSSSASSALGGGNMMGGMGGSGSVAATSAAAVVAGTGGVGSTGGGPAPPLGPRPVGVPGFTSGLGSSLIGGQQQQQQPQRPPGGPSPPGGGLSAPGGAPAPPSAPRPTSWASIAKSTAAVVPESAAPAKAAASRGPPGGAIPQPQVPKGPPPPSNLRAGYAPNTDPSSIAHSTRPGDWYCENCNAHNFASRNACFKCKEIKKNVTPVMQPPPQASSPTGSSGGGMEREFVPPPPLGNPSTAGANQVDDYDDDESEWLLAQRRRRGGVATGRLVVSGMKSGFSEGPPSSREQRDDDDDDGRGGFPKRSGDWLCDGCGAHNFASRGACFKCKK
ncbi:unnamed protein product [Bathycoccus prasinos]